MSEIVKVYREHIPPARLIGKRYLPADGPSGFSPLWNQWFEQGWFLPLEMLGALPESEGAFYGFMVARDGALAEYWIGMLFPAGTPAPEGYQHMDLPAGDGGICWVRGYEQDPTLYAMHDVCVQRLTQAGMQLPAGGEWHCFERYSCPRFTSPDDDGRVILDYGIYLA